ncbi:hypothetical protein KUCAC02_024073, partial [Chaenocephalus aceratus]
YGSYTEGDGGVKVIGIGAFAIPEKVSVFGEKVRKKETEDQLVEEPTLAQRRRGDLCGIGDRIG